jgi:hypothetical protein
LSPLVETDHDIDRRSEFCGAPAGNRRCAFIVEQEESRVGPLVFFGVF